MPYINLKAVASKNPQKTGKKRDNIANKSFNDLISDGTIEIPQEETFNIKNVKLTIEVLKREDNKDAESIKYLLNYKKVNTNQYKLVSISVIINDEQENMIEQFAKNKEPLDFILFSAIIKEYTKYTEIYYFNFSVEQEPVEGPVEEPVEEPVPANPVEEQAGGKLKAKGRKKKPSKKPVVSQSKENKYKEVLGKRMKIYKKPDSRKEFVRYKGELVSLVEYKKSKKEMAKSKNAKK